MKAVGFITEYNPFHYGHKYHLEKSKDITNATHTIAVMSGSFVQRGEPSLIDKWTKAKMAIDNGVDLVIELPFVYSVQSAELFAYGGIRILDAMNIVDFVAFGVENENIEQLIKISDTLIDEPAEFSVLLRKYLSQGLSFSSSRSRAIEDYLQEKGTDETAYSSILKKSNNILAIEYLKALHRLNSKIQPIAIKRQGDDYNDVGIKSNIASATGIRNKVLKDKLDSITSYLPEASYKYLKEFYDKYQTFNCFNNYNHIFQYIFRTIDADYLTNFMDMENGLENRIISISKKYYEIEKIVEKIATKRYPSTRIKRIFIHLLNDLTKEIIKEIYNNPVEYIRILGSNKKGFEILNEIKANTNLSIITKFSDFEKLNNESINLMLNIEKKATDLYYLGIEKQNPLVKMDYLTSPYIK